MTSSLASVDHAPQELEQLAHIEEQAGNQAWNHQRYAEATTHFELAAGYLKKWAAHVEDPTRQAAFRLRAAKLLELCTQGRRLMMEQVEAPQAPPKPKSEPLASRATNRVPTRPAASRPASSPVRKHSQPVPKTAAELPPIQMERSATAAELPPVDIGLPLRHGRNREVLAAIGGCDLEALARCFDGVAEDFMTAKTTDEVREVELLLTSVFAHEIARALRQAEPVHGYMELARKAWGKGNKTAAADHLKAAALHLISPENGARNPRETAEAEREACRLLMYSSRLRARENQGEN